MAPFRLTLAYDGTDFLGWQSQGRRGDARTVQGVLEAALGRLADGARVVVAGAGRTDAGVHAVGQVASFDLPRELGPAELLRALNAMLPEDVRVLDAERTHAGFHARKSAVSKLYRYVLDMGPIQLPARRRTAGHVPWSLDEARVRAAAAVSLGRHDFASLASAGHSVKTTLRTVTRSEATFAAVEGPWRADGPGGTGSTLIYEVEADGFLRKMVRSLVGGLVAVGRGALAVEDLERALEGRDRRLWPAPVAARGLTLVRVEYPPSAR